MSPNFPYRSQLLRLGSCVLAFFFVLLTFSSSQSQSGGQISGYVTGPSGAPMAGVKVKLYTSRGYGEWDIASTYFYMVKTDQNGYYHYQSIPADEYRVKFEPAF